MYGHQSVYIVQKVVPNELPKQYLACNNQEDACKNSKDTCNNLRDACKYYFCI